MDSEGLTDSARFNKRYNLRSASNPPHPGRSVPIWKKPRRKPRASPPSDAHKPPPEPSPVSQLKEEKPAAVMEEDHRIPPADDKDATGLESALLRNWYWNLYQSIGLTVKSGQSEVESRLREIRRKSHPDKRKGLEHVYIRAGVLHTILVTHHKKYRKMLQTTYVPHGGGLLDTLAMDAYLTNRRNSYIPKELPCILPENGPRFAEKPPRVCKKITDTRSEYRRTWSVFGH